MPTLDGRARTRVVPEGTHLAFRSYPGLSSWANECRRYAAGFWRATNGLYSAVPILFLATFVQAQQIQFRDITAQAGIHFVHNNAAFGKKYLPETMGPGCAFIDYDNDGWPDILLVNGEDWPGHAKTRATTLK